MPDLNLRTMEGTLIYYTDAGKALTSGVIFNELPDMDVFDGGYIDNIVKTYTPFNTYTVYKVPLARNYGSIGIGTAKVLSNSPAPFENSAARILSDFAKNKTKIDLIKCIYISTSAKTKQYECTIYTGFVNKSDLDNAKADSLSYGSYSFEVTDRKEAVGSVSGGLLSLTAR